MVSCYFRFFLLLLKGAWLTITLAEYVHAISLKDQGFLLIMDKVHSTNNNPFQSSVPTHSCICIINYVSIYSFTSHLVFTFFVKSSLKAGPTRLELSLCSSDHHLAGLVVVKASASRAKDPGFDSCLRWDFSRSSHTSDLKIGTPVATLPGAWHYRVSAGTGRSGVSIL